MYEKVIVTISSWNKRINNVYYVLTDILDNTVKPDKIVLNLAKDDFGFKHYMSLEELVLSERFPINLLNLIKNNDIDVHWYDDGSIKSWKKFEYVTKMYRDDNIIIAIDDDKRYSNVFIETMIKSFEYYGSKYPISFTSDISNGGVSCCGYALLYKSNMLNYFSSNLFTYDIMHMFPVDNHLQNIFNFLKFPILPVIGNTYLLTSDSYNETDPEYGNDEFGAAFYNDMMNMVCKSEEIMISNDKKGAAENKWNHICFHYGINNMIDYLNEHNYETLKPYERVIYDMFDNYIKKYAGNNIINQNVRDIIDVIKL